MVVYLGKIPILTYIFQTGWNMLKPPTRVAFPVNSLVVGLQHPLVGGAGQTECRVRRALSTWGLCCRCCICAAPLGQCWKMLQQLKALISHLKDVIYSNMSLPCLRFCFQLPVTKFFARWIWRSKPMTLHIPKHFFCCRWRFWITLW